MVKETKQDDIKTLEMFKKSRETLKEKFDVLLDKTIKVYETRIEAGIIYEDVIKYLIKTEK